MSNIKGIKTDQGTFEFEDTEGRALAQTAANDAIAGLLTKIQNYFEFANDGMVVNVEAVNCTVTYYTSNTFSKVATGNKEKHTRSKSTELDIPCNIVAAEPQINFTVVPNEGYSINNLEITVKNAEGQPTTIIDVCDQIKTPTGTIQEAGTYKDTNSNGENRYTAIKVKKPFTIVFNAQTSAVA